MITGFLLHKPSAKRRTFQLIPYQRINGKKVYSSPLKNADLDSLNQSVKDGTLTAAQALVEIKSNILPALRSRLGLRDKVLAESQVNENNLSAFKALWNKTYRRKKLECPQTAYDEFITAMRYLEPLSLHSSSADEIQDHWDRKLKGSRNKKYGNRINQILKHLGREFEIVTDRAVVPSLKFLTWEQLEKVLEKVEDPILKDLYRSLFGTGARVGEIFVLNETDIRENGTVYIGRQMTRSGEIKPYTKNKKSHDTVVLFEALPALKRWAAVKNKAVHRKRYAHPLTTAAKKTFPGEPTHQICPHKLRHSYVKKMMLLGMPLDRIAQFLGDKVSTVESTYRQWEVSDPEVDFVRAIMDEGYKRIKNSAD